MSASKARKLCLDKYIHPSRIKKSNQSCTTLCSNPRILYYILVRTIYPRGSSKETTNYTLLETLYYIIEGYSMDFAELIFKYMTKVCNLSKNYPLPYTNLLTYIFKVFQIFLKGKEWLDSQIPTIDKTIVKSLKFKPLPFGH